MPFLTPKQWSFDCHCTPQIHSIDLSKDKVVACNLIWKYVDSSFNWFMCGDLPTVSSNSTTATKIFAKAVLLKTILSEKWCTYSTNRACAKKFKKNYAPCTLVLKQVPVFCPVFFQTHWGFGESSCTQEHDIFNWHLLDTAACGAALPCPRKHAHKVTSFHL